MRIGGAATPSVAIPALDWLQASDHELDVVITRPDSPSGRGRSLQQSTVSKWASAHHIKCVKPVSEQEYFDALSEVDLVVTIGYGVILPVEILEIPRFGFINLHFSKLPAWRGAAPVQRALLNGDDMVGVSVFQLDSGMDTGPLYVQRDTRVAPHENAGELLERLSLMGPEAIDETIHAIESGVKPVAQSSSGASYAPKISKEETRIDWTMKAVQIDRVVRAFAPQPGAWTTFRGNVLRVNRAMIGLPHGDLAPGFLAIEGGSLLVGSGDGAPVIIEDVTPSGKKTMSAKNWLNGARVMPGERFE